MRCPLHVGREMIPVGAIVPKFDLIAEEEFKRVMLKCPISGCRQVGVAYNANQVNRPRCTQCNRPFSRAAGDSVHEARCQRCRRKVWTKWNRETARKRKSAARSTASPCTPTSAR